MALYDRQDKETSKSYMWFCRYRDLSPSNRSLPKVCQKYHKKKSYHAQLGRWSKKYNWVDRVEAWDDDQRKVATEKVRRDRQKELKDFYNLQVDIGKKFQNQVLKKLDDEPEAKDLRLLSMTYTTAFGVLDQLLVKDDDGHGIETPSEDVDMERIRRISREVGSKGTA